MPTTDNNDKSFFSGRFDFGVDPKRRVQIPSRWRPSQTGAELHVILWPLRGESEKHLLVMTPQIFGKLIEEIGKDSFFDEQGAGLRRDISESCMEVSLDSAGRICIPEWMAKAAGIEKEAVLVGVMERGFQVWNPQRYDLQRQKDRAEIQAKSHSESASKAANQDGRQAVAATESQT